MVHLKILQVRQVFSLVDRRVDLKRTREAFLLFLLIGGVMLRLTEVHISTQSCTSAAPALVRSGVSGRYLQLHGATGGKIKINTVALK